MQAEARVATEHAGRYLVQLCKHFGHRVPARFAEGVGRVEFSDGVVDLAAEGGVLVMRVSAAEPAGVERLSGVLSRHLERFAFRESLEVVWAAF
jgi:hypothetical protein